jgi:hypothetical protein
MRPGVNPGPFYAQGRKNMIIVKCWITTRALGLERMIRPSIGACVWLNNVAPEALEAQIHRAKQVPGPDALHPTVYVLSFRDDEPEVLRKARELVSEKTGVPLEYPR